jgi:hypothetical protein
MGVKRVHCEDFETKNLWNSLKILECYITCNCYKIYGQKTPQNSLQHPSPPLPIHVQQWGVGLNKTSLLSRSAELTVSHVKPGALSPLNRDSHILYSKHFQCMTKKRHESPGMAVTGSGRPFQYRKDDNPISIMVFENNPLQNWQILS